MIKLAAPIIVGNWKTTPQTLPLALTFIKQLDKKISSAKVKLPKKSYCVAVPDIFVPHINTIIKRGYVGSQNINGTSIGDT
jgi:hypothetical protein